MSLLFGIRGYAQCADGEIDPRPRFDAARGLLAANASASLIANLETAAPPVLT
jgi:hypothetical protein